MTNKRFPGNPTESYRTRHPLRVVSEVGNWEGHDPEVLKRMLDHLALLREQGAGRHRGLGTVRASANETDLLGPNGQLALPAAGRTSHWTTSVLSHLTKRRADPLPVAAGRRPGRHPRRKIAGDVRSVDLATEAILPCGPS